MHGSGRGGFLGCYFVVQRPHAPFNAVSSCNVFVASGEAIKKAIKDAAEGETVRAELLVSSSEKVRVYISILHITVQPGRYILSFNARRTDPPHWGGWGDRA